MTRWRLNVLMEVEANDVNWAKERVELYAREMRGVTVRGSELADPASVEELNARITDLFSGLNPSTKRE